MAFSLIIFEARLNLLFSGFELVQDELKLSTSVAQTVQWIPQFSRVSNIFDMLAFLQSNFTHSRFCFGGTECVIELYNRELSQLVLVAATAASAAAWGKTTPIVMQCLLLLLLLLLL